MTEIKDRGCWISRKSNYDSDGWKPNKVAYEKYIQGMIAELKEGRLRQGWGRKGMSLLDAQGQERSKEAWHTAYREAWGEELSSRSPRLAIMRRMRRMEEGDLVIVPHLPYWGAFTLCEVAGSYRFEEDAFFQEHGNFGHIIPIKPESIRESSKLSSTEAAQIEGHYKGRSRSAITDLSHHLAFKGWVAAQAEKPSDLEAREPTLIVKERAQNSRKVAAKALMEEARQNWEPSQLEKVVKHAFEQKGYAHVGSNSYDRKGADADHIFLPSLPGLLTGEDFGPDIMMKDPLILVQVKHKKGKDCDDTAGVMQLVKWNPPEESDEEVFLRILFSSADEPTDECRKRAEEHDVVLMFGVDAGLFLL